MRASERAYPVPASLGTTTGSPDACGKRREAASVSVVVGSPDVVRSSAGRLSAMLCRKRARGSAMVDGWWTVELTFDAGHVGEFIVERWGRVK